jgi:trehalose 6-phosphate synthase/phosphatase
VEWLTTAHLSDAHRALARDVMAAYADRIDGSFVEDKPLGVAWHYRAVGASGRAAARELLHHLSVVLARTSVTVQEGDMVIEVRAAGADKGAAVRRARAAAPADGLVVAIGDDRTDEDMFEALSRPHATVLVGARATRASLRIPDVQGVRACLSALAGIRAIAIRGHE